MKTANKKISKKEQLKLERKLIDSTNISIFTLENSISQSKKTFETIKDGKINLFDGLYHLCIYSTFAQTDLIILTEKCILAKRNYERLLFGRLIAHFIIEFLDDVNNLIGRDLLKDFQRMKYFSDFIPIFKNINKQVSIFKKKNEKTLRRIRNNSSAHKSKDSFLLHENIYGIDYHSILLLGIDLLSLSNQITIESEKVVRKITSLYNEVNNLLEEMKIQNRKKDFGN